MAEMLRISDLHAYYGESHILHGVDMHVNEGEVVTLLGRNGAGRTTTIKSIMGLVGRRTGSIQIQGQETVRWAPHQVARLGLGYCHEERGIFASLTCEENLMLPPALTEGGMSLDEIYDMFPNLLERRNSPGTRLSGGEQQMLAVARILRTGAKTPGTASEARIARKSGVNNRASTKHAAVVRAVRPVRPPASTPDADSM